MSLDNSGCPAELDPCDFVFPSIYQGTTVGAEITAHIESLVCAANDGSYCGIFDCDTATGAILTMIGQRVGWGREHCGVRPTEYFGFECDPPPPNGTGCDEPSVVGLCEPGAYFFCRLNGSFNYTFTDDELYRGFVKAAIIKNRARRFKELSTVKLVNEQIKQLWGDDAWVVSANDNAISVSAGRDLTAEEIEILSLYRRILCAGLGIELQIFCIAPAKPTDCNVNAPVAPVDFTIPCSTNGTVNFDSTVPFTDVDGDNITLTATSIPAGVVFTDLGGGLYNVTGPVTGVSQVVIVATDDGTPNLTSSPHTLTIDCTNTNVICPPSQTVNCDDFPFTLFGFINATNITISGQGPYSVSPNGTFDSVGFLGLGGDETVLITATNATSSCQTTITINGCTIQALNCPESINADEGVSIVPSILGGFSGGVAPYTILGGGNAFGPTPPTNMNFQDNGDGTWSIIGKPLGAGTFFYDVEVTDAVGNTADCIGNTVIVAGAINIPPTGPAGATLECVVGQPFNYTSPPFTDADGDTLTLTAFSVPAWMTFTDNQDGAITGDWTYSLSGTPTIAGSTNVFITVSDGNGGLHDSTLTINCAVNNLPPVCPADQNIDCANMPIVITGWSNVASLTAIGLSPVFGYTVVTDATAGTVTVSETSVGSGQDGVTFSILAQNGSNDCSVNINVSCGAANNPPVAGTFANQTHDEGTAEDYDISTCFTDADFDTLTYAVVSPATLPSGVTFSTVTGILSFDNTVADGTYSFEISANDGQATTNPNCTFDVVVSAAPTSSNNVNGTWACQAQGGGSELCEFTPVLGQTTPCGGVLSVIFNYNGAGQVSSISVSDINIGDIYESITISGNIIPLSFGSNTSISDTVAIDIRNAITANTANTISVICN